MRRVLESSGLLIDRKIYYNLIREKPLAQSNNLFEDLVLTLEEEGFKFSYLINNKLIDDNNCKERTLK